MSKYVKYGLEELKLPDKVLATKEDEARLKANAELLDDVKDTSNPRSLVNIVPTSVATAIKAIPQSILDMRIDELKRKAEADILLDRVRMSFWLEYNSAQLAGRDLSMTNICGGLITVSTFNKQIVNNSFKLAYMIRPTGQYKATLEDLMFRAMDQLLEILEMPLMQKKFAKSRNGNIIEYEEIDTKLAQVKAQIARDVMIQARGHGVQKVETKSQTLNTNVNIDAKEAMSMAEIEAQLRDIDQKLESRVVKEIQSGEIQIEAANANEESEAQSGEET